MELNFVKLAADAPKKHVKNAEKPLLRATAINFFSISQLPL